MYRFLKAILFISLQFLGINALAAYPKPWQINFQEAASPVMEEVVKFHNLLLYICFAIPGLVLILLIYVAIRFNKKSNPNPSKTSHHTLLEIIWTAIPAIILVFLAIPSLKILYFSDKIAEPEMTLKVVGRQWFWQYQYPDNNEIAFDSYMVQDKDLLPGQIRLLEVDNRVVLPVDTNIRILVTAGDVIHSWAVPALGIKTDAVPGRVNETWVKINKPGVYYGQCSELCGVNHGFMPIAIEAVSKEEFENWTKVIKEKFANNNSIKIVNK